MASLTVQACSLIVLPCIVVALYKLWALPIRWLLQTLFIVPVLVITSVLVSVAGAILKCASWIGCGLIPAAYNIYYSQLLYNSFSALELFVLEFWPGLQYVVSGTEITSDIRNLNTILIGNHSASLFDFVPFGSICDSLDRIANSFVFVKKEIMFYPVMGWIEAVTAHGVCLERDWDKDKLYLAEMCNKFNAGVDYKLVSPWMWFIFPEGTRFSPKKLVEAQAFAKKRGYEVYNHLLQPRVKGFSYVTHHLYETLGCIIDCTILYKDKPATLTGLLCATRFCKYVHVHFRVYEKKDIPNDIESLNQWIRDRFTEKDTILCDMKEGKIAFKKYARSSWRSVVLYSVFAIVCTYITMVLCAGYQVCSVVFWRVLICALLPVPIVWMEERDAIDYAKKV